MKFCEVLKTDLFFSFSVSRTLAFACFFSLKSKVLTGFQNLRFFEVSRFRLVRNPRTRGNLNNFQPRQQIGV